MKMADFFSFVRKTLLFFLLSFPPRLQLFFVASDLFELKWSFLASRFSSDHSAASFFFLATFSFLLIQRFRQACQEVFWSAHGFFFPSPRAFFCVFPFFPDPNEFIYSLSFFPPNSLA